MKYTKAQLSLFSFEDLIALRRRRERKKSDLLGEGQELRSVFLVRPLKPHVQEVRPQSPPSVSSPELRNVFVLALPFLSSSNQKQCTLFLLLLLLLLLLQLFLLHDFKASTYTIAYLEKSRSPIVSLWNQAVLV